MPETVDFLREYGKIKERVSGSHALGGRRA